MTYEIKLMIGIPGSGKTTWASSEIKRLEKGNYTVAYISRDEIRFSILEENDDYFQRENQVFSEFMNRINSSIAAGFNYVIIDATHISPASRAKVLRRLRVPGYTALTAEIMDCPLSEALRRNSLRKGRARVPDEALKDMYDNYSVPSIEELRAIAPKCCGFYINRHKEG